jgi:hypothetical protein
LLGRPVENDNAAMENELSTNEPSKAQSRKIGCDGLVTVYTTNNPNDAEIIRAELLGEGIMSRVNGTGQAGMPGSIITRITVDVPAADADRARAFICDAAVNSHQDGSSASVRDDADTLNPVPPRRLFQFRLRTLLVITAALAVLCWIASLTKWNWGTFYAVTWFGFILFLIVARIKVWSSKKGPGEYETFY